MDPVGIYLNDKLKTVAEIQPPPPSDLTMFIIFLGIMLVMACVGYYILHMRD